MARGRYFNGMGDWIKNAKTYRDKLTFRILLSDCVVEVAQNDSRVALPFGEISQKRAHHAHEEGGGHALVADIGDSNSKTIGADIEIIIKVPRNFIGGQQFGMQIETFVRQIW